MNTLKQAPTIDQPITGPAADLLDDWIGAVGSLDPQAAADLYATHDLAFWGTFGEYCRTTRPQARAYFDRFLDAEFVACEVREIHWREFGPQATVATGWYSFVIRRPGEPAAKETRARFTFVFSGQDDGQWKIVEHHSSLFPENGF